MFNQNRYESSKDKISIINTIHSDAFKRLFTVKGINNVIIFGSLANGDFTSESDVDIAIISNNTMSFNDELILTKSLEELLDRDIDLIDINDENINNLVKISALNSKFIVLSDGMLAEKIGFYDNIFRENEEFWRILDREALGTE